MKVIDIKSKDSIHDAAKVLKNSGILVFPTDTVYGIGCLNKIAAIKKLYQIKNRLLSQPTTILIDKDNLLDFNISENVKSSFYTGETTLIVSRDLINFKPCNILLKNEKVGVRIPNNLWLRDLIRKVGLIVASSANKKGQPTPGKFDEIDSEIISQVDIAFRTDEKLSGKASRVYDLETKKYFR
ncbi:MAG: rimN [Candidatus Berkelbacteria bacterium]|nr:rimN [Candidatus Berkelbacteria bacterium]